jgi:hypothetical protein
MNDLSFKSQHNNVKIQNFKKAILNNDNNKKQLFNIRNESELSNYKLNK